jgi:hypothetical protein
MGNVKDMENIHAFCDEFVQMMHDCNVKDDNMLLTEVFVCRFPNCIIWDIQVAWFSNVEKPINTVQEVADLVVKMATLLELEEGDTHRKSHSTPDFKKSQSSTSSEQKTKSLWSKKEGSSSKLLDDPKVSGDDKEKEREMDSTVTRDMQR